MQATLIPWSLATLATHIRTLSRHKQDRAKEVNAMPNLDMIVLRATRNYKSSQGLTQVQTLHAASAKRKVEVKRAEGKVGRRGGRRGRSGWEIYCCAALSFAFCAIKFKAEPARCH